MNLLRLLSLVLDHLLTTALRQGLELPLDLLQLLVLYPLMMILLLLRDLSLPLSILRFGPGTIRREERGSSTHSGNKFIPPTATLTARFREGYIYLRNRGRKGGRNSLFYSPYQTLCNFLRLG